MKRVVLIFLTLLTFLCSNAQSALEGVVKDENGDPLIGANVLIKNSYQGTITDPEGRFVIHSVKDGEYVLQISFVGFSTHEQAVVVNGRTAISVDMKRSMILADAVIVSALRVKNYDPVAYTNIRKDELARMNTGKDIPFLLSQTPSLVATSETGIGIGYTALRIRGSDPTRINVTINGIPLNDSESQGVFWVNMPDFASSVENIQIQRGVGSSTNGAAAFGGTINFQTSVLNKDPYLEIRGNAGSFNTFKNSISMGTGLLKDKFSFDTRVSLVRSDGYIKHSGSDHRSFYLTGAYHARKSLVRGTIISGEEHTGISWWGVPDYMLDIDRRYNPAGEYTDNNGEVKYYTDQKDNYKQTHYQLHVSQELSTSLNANIALHYTRGAGYYEQYMDDDNDYHSTGFYEYGLDSLVVVNNDTVTQSDLVRQKWLDNDFYGFTYAINYRANKMEASMGGGWNKYDGDHFGRITWMERNNLVPKDFEWYFNVGKKTDWNAFLKVNYFITSGLSAYADFQYRNISYKMSGPDDDLKDLTQNHRYDFYNPKVGLFYSINSNNKAFISFAVGNREPTRTNFKDAAGDPESTPEAERLYDFEAGYNLNSSNMNLGINLYYMYYLDQLVPTGEKNNVGYDIMTNVEKSYRTGLEMYGALQLFDRITWNLNLTLSENMILDYTEYASYYDENWNEDYLPKHLGKSHLAYSPSVIGSSSIRVGIIKDLNIYLLTKYVGSQYFDNTSSEARKIDAYSVSDIRIEYILKPRWTKEAGIQFQLNNVCNRQYLNNAYGGNWYEQGNEKTWAYYFPQAGINFLAGLFLKF